MSEYVKQRLAEIAAEKQPNRVYQPPKRIEVKKESHMTATIGYRKVNAGLNGNGCGHDFLMTDEHYEACKESGRTWYCTVCGCARIFGGKSTVDQLRGELAAAKQREETEKHNRRLAEEKLAKEAAANKRLKKRVKNGVCPCCTRSFTNLRQHIATKHPEFQAETK